MRQWQSACILILTTTKAIVASRQFLFCCVTFKSKSNDYEVEEKSKRVGIDLLLGDTPLV